jgi:protein TonB
MDLTYNSSQSSSRRLSGFLVVVALHVGIGYALVNGLARKIVDVIKPPVETKIVEDVKPPPPDVPPPPPPKLALPPPPVYIPPVEVNIQAPPPPTQNVIMSVTSKPQSAPVPRVVAPTGVRIPPVIDAARSCQQPEYPAASRRNEETGTVLLRFLIGVDGKVIDSKVESSSGYTRLDTAAIRALSQCQFKAGTLDGKPEQSWASLKYVWQLQ